jgi:hypothetical protein
MEDPVAEGLHIVVAQPPAEVADSEFNTWYDAHLQEILSVPGFASARRYRLEAVVAPGTIPHRFVCVYETDIDPREAVAELERAGMRDKGSYSDLKDRDTGELPLPPWFDRVSFASWNCLPLGERRVG